MLDDLQLDSITDPHAREVIQRLLNHIETVIAEVDRLKAENLLLRDEVNRLKGAQGRPTGPHGRTVAPDVSSDAERRVLRGRVRQPKIDQIAIHREVRCPVDPALLPPDAQYKGTVVVIVQDLELHSDNIRFLKEKWYAPSTGQTYLGPLPEGYDGQFGPQITSLAWLLSNVGQMSQSKIREVFRLAGIRVSSGHLGQILIQQANRDAEATEVAEASLAATPWQQVDHTVTRVNGDDQQCHILTTPLATVAHTHPGKDRLSTLDSLRNNRPRTFLWNAEAEAILFPRGLSAGVRRNRDLLPRDTVFDAAKLTHLLDTHVANAGRTQRQWIVEARALAAYRVATDEPVVQMLLSDDAPQLGGICADHALCWVHDGRQYKSCVPGSPSITRRCAPSWRTIGPPIMNCVSIRRRRPRPNGDAWKPVSTRSLRRSRTTMPWMTGLRKRGRTAPNCSRCWHIPNFRFTTTRRSWAAVLACVGATCALGRARRAGCAPRMWG